MATIMTTIRARKRRSQPAGARRFTFAESRSLRRAVPPAHRTDPLWPVERRDARPSFEPIVDEIELAGVEPTPGQSPCVFQNWSLLEPNRLLVAVGQIHHLATAHNSCASILASKTWAALRAHAEHEDDAGQLLTNVNRTLESESVGGQFISLNVALVDTVGGRVELAMAGKCLALRIRASSCRPIRLGLPCIADGPNEIYRGEILELQPRERLAFVVGLPSRAIQSWDQRLAGLFQGLDAPTHRQMTASEALGRLQSAFAGRGSNKPGMALVRRR